MIDDFTRARTAGIETFDLFRMQPGIPLEHAMNQLSVLLGCIRHLTTEAEMEDDRIAGSAARILSELAKALIDDLERGMCTCACSSATGPSELESTIPTAI